MGNRWGNSGNSVCLYFSGIQNHCSWWLQPWNEKTLTPWKESYDQPVVKLFSRVRIFVIPWTVAHQAPLSVEFSRQEYWTRLPFPSPRYLPNPGIKPRSPALRADALPSEPPGNLPPKKCGKKRRKKMYIHREKNHRMPPGGYPQPWLFSS